MPAAYAGRFGRIASRRSGFAAVSRHRFNGWQSPRAVHGFVVGARIDVAHDHAAVANRANAVCRMLRVVTRRGLLAPKSHDAVLPTTERRRRGRPRKHPHPSVPGCRFRSASTPRSCRGQTSRARARALNLDHAGNSTPCPGVYMGASSRCTSARSGKVSWTSKSATSWSTAVRSRRR